MRLQHATTLKHGKNKSTGSKAAYLTPEMADEQTSRLILLCVTSSNACVSPQKAMGINCMCDKVQLHAKDPHLPG